MVHQLAINQITTCGVCSTIGHPSDVCPTLLNGNVEQANATGGFPGQQRKYDPYAPIFNPRWKDHPNLSYSGNHYIAPNNPAGFNNPKGQQTYQPRQPTPLPNQGNSIEDMITALTNSTFQF